MKTGVHQVKVLWLGTLALKRSTRELAFMALRAIDDEDVRSLLVALRGLLKPGVTDQHTCDLAQGVIDALEREERVPIGAVPVCPRCLGLEPGKPGGDPLHPHAGPFTPELCSSCQGALEGRVS